MSDISLIQEEVVDIVGMGDPALRNFLIPRIPQYWQLAMTSRCSIDLIRLEVMHNAILDAMVLARNLIGEESATSKSRSWARSDASNFADSKGQSVSQSTAMSESFADRYNDWSRRSFADASGFSIGSESSNSNSRADGYDRSTRSSFSRSKSDATSTSTESGRSSQKDETHGNSLQTVMRTVGRWTGGGPYVNGGAKVTTEEWFGQLGAQLSGSVHNESGNVFRSHNSWSETKRTPGSNFTYSTSKRSNSSDTASQTKALDTTVAGSSDQHNVHRDSEAHSRANAAQTGGAKQRGEGNSINTNSGDSQAHGEGQSSSTSTSAAQSHSEGAGSGESFSTRKSKAIYYSQIFESLKIMAQSIWQEIMELNKLEAAGIGSAISQLRYTRPGATCEPRASLKQIQSPGACANPVVCSPASNMRGVPGSCK